MTTDTHTWPVYGHDWAVAYLRKSMLHDRIRQAYLITGTSSIGKYRLAYAFAMALNCLHEDILSRPCGGCRSCKRMLSGNHIDTIFSQTDSGTGALKIDAIRGICGQLAMKPYESRYRIAILEDFDNAQPRAQDALLKTLEEPPAHAVLILLATSLEPVLSTIKSRSQIIYLRPVETNVIHNVLVGEYNLNDDDATLLARLSSGRIGWTLQAAENPEMLTQRDEALTLLEEIIRQNRAQRFDLAQGLAKDKPALIQLLELWLTYWRDVLLQTENSPVNICNIDREVAIQQMAYDVTPEQAFNALQATREMLSQLNFNINVRLALEVMFLDYPGLVRE